MQTNTVITVVAGPTAFVFTTVLAARRLVALFGDAQAANDLLVLFRDANVNWDLAYFWVAAVSCAAVLAANWRHVAVWRARRTARRRRVWNMPAAEVLNYIARRSYLTMASGGDALVVAHKAFLEAARSGRLSLVGRRRDSGTLEPIKPRAWRVHSPRIDVERDRRDVVQFKPVIIRDKEQVEYEGIMANSRDVGELWPERPRTDGF